MNNIFRNPKSLTILALMLAITVVLDVTPLGAIPLGAISATIVHIPAIITGIILGPLAGFIMSTLLGLISLIHALTRPVTVLDPLFVNPLISVLPRMFIGVVSYYAYTGIMKLIRKGSIRQTASALIGGIAGSLTNTFLVFLMLYLVYAKEVAEKIGVAFNVVAISVFTSNAIAEAIVSAIITVAVTAAYFRYSKSKI